MSWKGVLNSSCYKDKLVRIQRLINIKIAKAYRTVSKEALCIITGLTLFNAELNPICHLLALLGAHHILHVGRIRVNVNKH